MAMSYLTLLFCFTAVELCRRICLVLIKAYTGPLSKIPGPTLMKFTSIPWHFVQIRGKQHEFGPEMFAKYGDVVRVSPNFILVTGKDAIQKVVVEDDMKKGPDYDLVNSSPSVTTLFTERDKIAYRQKRRMMSPGFSIAYLNGLEGSMKECTQVFEDVLNSECAQNCGSAVVDMLNMLSNLGSRQERTVLYANFPFLSYLPFMPPLISHELNNMVNDIVEKRRTVPKDKRKKDLLQIFLDANEENPTTFTEDVLRAEIQLFMIAGSDTTSYTATCCVLLLLNNASKLQALIKEVDAVFPSKDDPITFAKAQDLPYLNGVINEALRIMPAAAAGLQRETTTSTIINGFEVPAGTIINPWIAAPMKDKRLWPDPEDFIPERWLGNYKGVEPDRKAFLPFSAGSRNCIGQQYALRELRLILVTLLRRFELNLIPGQSHDFLIKMIPRFKSGKYLVGVKPRTS